MKEVDIERGKRRMRNAREIRGEKLLRVAEK